MSVLIKNATIVDSSSSFHGKTKDLLIVKGEIAKIGDRLDDPTDQTINGKNLMVSSGWVDVMADYCEPGFEHKETLESGMSAAAAGGFSDVLLVPNTQPSVSTKSVVEYIQKKTHAHAVQIRVMGSISQNIEGKDLAEMLDMYHSGAVAFTDGWKPVQDAGLMLKALEYVKAFSGILLQVPIHSSLSKGGLMNESQVSLRLGMSGIPPIAESLMVHRDIELLRYTGSRLHFSGISTGESLRLIQAAKKDGLAVTCSVTPYHLLFSDEILEHYESVYKVAPPLRTEEERRQLIQGLEDGIIDCIATHHRPEDWDGKTKEFEYAAYGMIGQETCWPMLLAAAPNISMERWVELLSENPRKIFHLPQLSIEEGITMPLTVFDKDTHWHYQKDLKLSLGMNSPFFNKELIGKASLIV